MSQQTAAFEGSSLLARIQHAIRSNAPFVPIFLAILGLIALLTYAIIAVVVYSIPVAEFLPAPTFGLMPYNG